MNSNKKIEQLKSVDLSLNEINLIAVSCDENGNITYVSPATESIIGFKPESLLGDKWWDLTYFSKEEGQIFKQKLCKTIAKKETSNPKPYDRKLKCKDGTLKWIEFRDSFTVDNRFVSVGVDITEWKKNEEIKVQSDTIINSIDSIVLVSDIDGNVIFASPSVTKMIGYAVDEIMGDKWWKVTYDNEHNANYIKNSIYKEVFLDLKKDANFSRQKIKTREGTYKWIEWQISKGVNNTYISIGTDVTSRNLTEIELKKAKEFAEESLKAKNEFLANMSHEIRTPLNAVIGFTDLLLETNLSAEQIEYLKTMQNSGNILLSLINNVLDLSKLESNKLTIEEIPFNLHNKVKEVVKLMKIKADEKGINLNLIIENGTPTQVKSDPTKIGQILLNLIGNAVKFTNEGSVILTVKPLQEEGKIRNVYFEIKDTGIGIVSNKINTVFGAFTQAKSDTSRIYGGTGLGLAIVKKLVSLLKGTIKVESVFGKGSVFKLTLPLKQISKQVSDDKLNLNHSQEQQLDLKVLLVEDNKTNQLLAKIRLEKWGCKVAIANNGIEGVKLTQKEDFDIILMDIQMPVMDGFEATKIIKNDISEKASKIPIIAMTAYTSNAEINRAMNYGMEDYIFKPFKPTELFDILKKYGNIVKANHDKEKEKEEVQVTPKNNNYKKYTDLKFLKEESLNEDSILILLIEIFIKDFEEYLKTFEIEFKNKNWEKLHAATHKIKPNISMFGIAKLDPIIFSLDTKFKNETNLEDVEILFEKCKEIFKIVKVELLNELKSLNHE
ncbi:PAS domain-containing hybrid sensor histidine kinase/response regulator [uncultured Lutibacter sp.]|uniref:PAS domain-containing hybrid sensor histidine kinase/response regulator n=1 Tax=uncultured Lutibacter sp. TaxID=437739 RepID=UPI00261DCCCB|nr:PAS domain-containing hybrid sensor histidine kinase/response regulator [uncultured Lutibacter sp.]